MNISVHQKIKQATLKSIILCYSSAILTGVIHFVYKAGDDGSLYLDSPVFKQAKLCANVPSLNEGKELENCMLGHKLWEERGPWSERTQ